MALFLSSKVAHCQLLKNTKTENFLLIAWSSCTFVYYMKSYAGDDIHSSVCLYVNCTLVLNVHIRTSCDKQETFSFCVPSSFSNWQWATLLERKSANFYKHILFPKYIKKLLIIPLSSNKYFMHEIFRYALTKENSKLTSLDLFHLFYECPKSYSTLVCPLTSFLQLIWLHPVLSAGKDHFHAMPEINNIMHEMLIQFLFFFCSILHFVLLKLYGDLCQMPTNMDPTKGNFHMKEGKKKMLTGSIVMWNFVTLLKGH